MTDSRRETQWVLRAQTGDKAALNSLLEVIQEPLYRYIFGIVGEDQLARDVLQDSFLQIFRKLYWLKEPKAFRSWAYRIASRRAFECLRQERRYSLTTDESVLAESTTMETSRHDNTADIVEQLPGLLQRVSPASRAVLSLHYLNGMTLRETADVLEISLGSVKSRLAYGLSRLREQIQRIE